MSTKIKQGRSAQAIGATLFLGSIAFSSKTYVHSEKVAFALTGVLGLGLFLGGSIRVAFEKQKVEVVE